MAFHIPDDKISEIKNRADIVDIVSEVVLLKNAGRNYLGLCPFHAEKTPSFTVSPDKQMFHCFGCHEGGNVFTFLMKHQGLTFPEAVQLLAKRYGVEIPRPQMTDAQKRAWDERQTLLTVIQQAADFFQQQLQSPPGEKARRYLEKRGVDASIQTEFRLGYAPAGWENLVNYFQKKSVPLKTVAEAGLIARKHGYYDRFRDRVIFPTTDAAGRVVGFGGRVLDDSLPKYLNSPETALYNKRRILYGLSQVKQHCRQAGTVYITEGYMDFLALYRHGFKNVVATLGTALTEEHVRLLKGYVQGAVLVFDSDQAGLKAAHRSVSIFQNEPGIDPYILTLPEGYDPDTYLADHGREAFEKCLGGARGALSFLLDGAIEKHGLSVEGKLHVLHELRETLAAISDTVTRAVYVKEVAERVGIAETAIMEKIQQVQSSPKGALRGPASTNGAAAKIDGRSSEGENPLSATASRERQVIAMLLHVPEMLAQVAQSQVLEYFQSDLLRSVGRLALANPGLIQSGQPGDLALQAENENQKRVITALAVGDELSNWDDPSRCYKLIEQIIEARRNRQGSLLQLVKTAEQTQDDKLDDLLRATRDQKKQRIKKIMAYQGEKAL